MERSSDNADCHLREYDSCKGLPFYAEHEGQRYCVLHLPSEDKKDDFKKALDEKLGNQDFNFAGAFFPSGTAQFEGYEFVWANFSRATFSEKTSFRAAQFSGRTSFFAAQFSGESTEFGNAQFSGESTSFSEVQFSGKMTSFFAARFSGKNTYFIRARFGGETSFFAALFISALTHFSKAQFSGESTSFSEVQFSGKRTDFEEAQFSGKSTDFSKAQFSGESTDFSVAQFSGKSTDFSRAKFTSKETAFEEVAFTGNVFLDKATFQEKVAFLGTEQNMVFRSHSLVRFDHCRIDKPELITFNTVLLRPGWFINTDVRKVDFTDVVWHRLLYESKSFKHTIGSLKGRVEAATKTLKEQLHKTEDQAEILQKPETKALSHYNNYRHPLNQLMFYGSSLAQAWQRLTATALDDDIEALTARNLKANQAYTLLAQACQRLAANAEENRNHAHASGFNYWAMDAQRKGKRASAFAPWRLIWWYWALSGYGERTWRSGLWLIGILLGFAVLYMRVAYVQPPNLSGYVQIQELSFSGIWQGFRQAVIYSLGVMSRQADKLSCADCMLLRTLVFIEGILGPLQES